jgi:DNA-binding CsgD family transcriptional regulator
MGADAMSRERGDTPVPFVPAGLQATRFELDGSEYVVFAFPVPELQPPPGLTAAEQEVVRGVLRDQSNIEIAAARGTSVRTVANQLQSIFRKLGISGRAELVRCCDARVTPPSG